ncbi:MAG: acyltransferase domain-containing protein, partial [Myxococcota bacterium]
MATQLYHEEPEFREVFDDCLEHFGRASTRLPDVLRRLLLAESDDNDNDAAVELARTELAQPGLFSVQYALARLWQAMGVEPEAMIGHSLGEIVAACLAGVLSLADATGLVARRAALMAECPPGAMLATAVSRERAASLIPPGVSLAAVNAHDQCVLSGPHSLIDELSSALTNADIPAKKLVTSHGFHSELMTPVIAPLVAHVRRLRLSPPRVPIVSTVTGHWMSDEQACDPEYWGRQVSDTVQFADAYAQVVAQPGRTFVCVAPNRVMGQMLRAQSRISDSTSGSAEEATAVSEPTAIIDGLDPVERGADYRFARALGQAWMAGLRIDWA